MDAAVVVPIAALVLGVVSFWWASLRRGRLVMATPRTYASTLNGMVRLRFPLAILNTGAAAIITTDMRALVDGQVLVWISIRKTIRPETDDVSDFASPFSVRGRDVVHLFAEFGIEGDGRPTWSPDEHRAHGVVIERMDLKGRWRELGKFDWWPPPANHRSQYLAKRNVSQI